MQRLHLITRVASSRGSRFLARLSAHACGRGKRALRERPLIAVHATASVPAMIADLRNGRHVRTRHRAMTARFRNAACYICNAAGSIAHRAPRLRESRGNLMYTLYYSPGAASFAVHHALLELGVPHALRRVDLSAGEQRTPAYLALNPNGVVPTLLVDEQPVYEAAALLMLLAERHPEARLAPPIDAPTRPLYLQWMLHFANVVQPLFRLWFSPQDVVGSDATTEAKEIARGNIEAAWQRFDAHVAKHGPYSLGADFGVVDIYATMLMRWSRNMPKPATSWPALAELAARVKARPSWRELYAIEGLTEWA
jgi:glutathione S-transferase